MFCIAFYNEDNQKIFLSQLYLIMYFIQVKTKYFFKCTFSYVIQ